MCTPRAVVPVVAALAGAAIGRGQEAPLLRQINALGAGTRAMLSPKLNVAHNTGTVKRPTLTSMLAMCAFSLKIKRHGKLMKKRFHAVLNTSLAQRIGEGEGLKLERAAS